MNTKRAWAAFWLSILCGIFIAVAIFLLTKDVLVASTLGFGMWMIVYVVSVGVVSTANNLHDMKETQLKIVELLEWVKQDRQSHR